MVALHGLYILNVNLRCCSGAVFGGGEARLGRSSVLLPPRRRLAAMEESEFKKLLAALLSCVDGRDATVLVLLLPGCDVTTDDIFSSRRLSAARLAFLLAFILSLLEDLIMFCCRVELAVVATNRAVDVVLAASVPALLVF